MKGRGNGRSPRKPVLVWRDSHLPKSGVNRPGIEPGSQWWEASSLTTQPALPHDQQPDRIDFKRVYAEVTFAIVSEFIRHALDDSAPIADLQGNKKRIPYCKMWGKTGATANEQTSEVQLNKGSWSLAYSEERACVLDDIGTSHSCQGEVQNSTSQRSYKEDWTLTACSVEHRVAVENTEVLELNVDLEGERSIRKKRYSFRKLRRQGRVSQVPYYFCVMVWAVHVVGIKARRNFGSERLDSSPGSTAAAARVVVEASPRRRHPPIWLPDAIARRDAADGRRSGDEPSTHVRVTAERKMKQGGVSGGEREREREREREAGGNKIPRSLTRRERLRPYMTATSANGNYSGFGGSLAPSVIGSSSGNRMTSVCLLAQPYRHLYPCHG
ncbi:hypothetical protein PR048_003526 [Dryococelus australis]|uniref:Uncharacterized protein n=1 Tax=Dryococelus australis TaxID=614101 RepID=A0ABQ9IND1_9NEOP|nr:hypothetical protein PR048_003526 [Dryococelus australis]